MSGCFYFHKKVHNEMKTISFHQRELIDETIMKTTKLSELLWKKFPHHNSLLHMVRVTRILELLAFHYSSRSGKYAGGYN